MSITLLNAPAHVLIERRAHEREDVFYPARGSISDEASFDCIVMNLSHGGALISFSRTDIAPAKLKLLIPQCKTIYECETVWSKNGEAGVRFLSSQPCDASKI